MNEITTIPGIVPPDDLWCANEAIAQNIIEIVSMDNIDKVMNSPNGEVIIFFKGLISDLSDEIKDNLSNYYCSLEGLT